MKKYFSYALSGAIALTSMYVLTACSSDQPLAAQETKTSEQGAAEGEVTTQFVFNVANGNTPITRQSSTATQASSDLAANEFRGIDNSYIMCFKDAEGGAYVKTAKSINMARVVAPGTLSNSESRRVLEMSLPLNTNKMMFYGKAIVSDDNHNNRNTYGYLSEFSVTDNLANVNFQLGKRLDTEANKTKFQEVQKLMAAVLSCIINTNRGNVAVDDNDVPEEGISPYGFDIAADKCENMLWAAYNSETSPYDGGALSQLEVKLGKAYKELTTVQEAELRNASGFALKETVKNLWSIVNSVRCATPTDEPEALAKYMANRIHTELLNYFTATVPKTGASVTDVSIKQASTLITA